MGPLGTSGTTYGKRGISDYKWCFLLFLFLYLILKNTMGTNTRCIQWFTALCLISVIHCRSVMTGQSFQHPHFKVLCRVCICKNFTTAFKQDKDIQLLRIKCMRLILDLFFRIKTKKTLSYIPVMNSFNQKQVANTFRRYNFKQFLFFSAPGRQIVFILEARIGELIGLSFNLAMIHFSYN